MNESDTEIIRGILEKAGFIQGEGLDDTDIVFLNTCAVREGAENKIWSRLQDIKAFKRKEKKQLFTGVLGCMAERLKDKLVEKNKVVDIIVGPDAYRDLPRLISSLDVRTFINNHLSHCQQLSTARSSVRSFSLRPTTTR